MKPIRVLIVDDSDVCRQIFAAILSSTDNDIKVIGEAKNGQEAVKMVQRLKPDIVTMDIAMPVMDGIEAIKRIMTTNAVPILVISEADDANLAFTALAEGALEVIAKSDVNIENGAKFVKKIKLLSGVKVITHIRGKGYEYERGSVLQPAKKERDFEKVVAIASSTGGPKVLAALLQELPSDFPYPIVIAQHISNGFVDGLVEWLDSIAKLKVKAGNEGETVMAGTVYLSPTEKHMALDDCGKITLIEKKPKDIYSPSCDILLSSVANIYRTGLIGIILTGMGDDGVMGIRKIKEAGGTTIAQDEKSSAIFGMPKVAIDSGSIDKVLPLDKIGDELVQIAKNKKRE